MLSKVPHWLLFQETVFTTQEYIRDVSAINPLWLCKIAPHLYEMIDTNAKEVFENP